MTSGAIQNGVPTKVLRLFMVSVSCPATPKSASFTHPSSDINTLAANEREREREGGREREREGVGEREREGVGEGEGEGERGGERGREGERGGERERVCVCVCVCM